MRLFDLVAGFVYSQTLAISVDTGLLESLLKGPQDTTTLAQVMALPEEAAKRLLGAAAALDLVEPVGRDRFMLGAQGAALLGNPGLVQMVQHHARLYADLADGVALMRRGGGGGLAAFWPYATAAAPRCAPPEAVTAYSALMAATSPAVAADVFQAYPIERHRKLLDVGGGDGSFLRAAAARAPDLELSLFDLPPVAAIAREAFGSAQIAHRVEIIAGDFLTDPVPSGADLVTLIRIVHDHDDQGVTTLFRSIRAGLAPGGVVLIAEPMSASTGRDRIADVYFALYLQAMGRGRARTPAEIQRLLGAAGFTRTRELSTRSPFLLRAVMAQA